MYEVFEENYLQCTRNFHKTLYAQSSDLVAFLDVCLDRSGKEVARAHAVLPEISWGTAQLAAEGGLLDGHAKELANDGQFVCAYSVICDLLIPKF